MRAGADAASVDHFGDRDHRRDLPVLSLRRHAGADRYSAAGLVDLAGRVEARAVAYAADLENHPRLVRRLARDRRLLGNPPDVLRRARDPFRVTRLLAEAGVPVPEARRPDDPPGSDDGGWLRKPVRGGGGRGVRPWREGERPGGGEYLQRRIPGTPVALLFVADGRRARLLGATEMLVGRQAFGAEGFLYCGGLLRRGGGGRPLPPPGWPAPSARASARRIVAVLTRRLGLRGLNGVDAILHEGELWPVEVNPRWTSSMELLEPGDPAAPGALPGPLFALHRRAFGGTLPRRGEPPGGADGGTPSGVVGKAVIRARHDARAPPLEALEGLSPAPGARAGRQGSGWRGGDGVAVADVPEPGDPLHRGGPVCTLLAAAGDRAGCLEKLEAAAGLVHRALARTG